MLPRAGGPSHSSHQPIRISTRDWNLDGLLRRSKKFRKIRRVNVQTGAYLEEIQNYENTVDPEPLVVENWQTLKEWPNYLFSLDGVLRDFDDALNVRNVHTREDSKILLKNYIDGCHNISPFRAPGETVRNYGKDIDCPDAWTDWLRSGVIPEVLTPESKGDYLAKLQKDSVQTLMCYIGIGDTYTPCHKDLCASSGHNLMCYTEHSGSAFWFMTRGSDAPKMSKWFQEKLDSELDHDDRILTLAELARAPVDTIYITEQKLGDLVLVPPRSCHQVVNYGGLTVKMSWSRMTIQGLETAFHCELPIYRRVCRPEIYRVRATIYHALLESTIALEDLNDFTKLTLADLATHTRVTDLFGDILVDETPPTGRPVTVREARIDTPTESLCDIFQRITPISCHFCGADIFNSWMQCEKCPSDVIGESIQLCVGCYTEGRSCLCGLMDAKMHRPFDLLEGLRSRAVAVHMRLESKLRPVSSSPRPNSGFDADLAGSPPPATDPALPITLRKPRQDEGLFITAGLMVYDATSRKRTFSCRHRAVVGVPGHMVSSTAAINCRICRKALCLRHVLEDYRLHAVDAIGYYKGDHKKYHSQHVGRRAQYDRLIPTILQAQKDGKPVDRELEAHARTYFALSYPNCMPVAQHGLKLGWYDENACASLVDSDETSEDDKKPMSRQKAFARFSTTTPSPAPETRKIPKIRLPGKAPMPSSPAEQRPATTTTQQPRQICEVVITVPSRKPTPTHGPDKPSSSPRSVPSTQPPQPLRAERGIQTDPMDIVDLSLGPRESAYRYSFLPKKGPLGKVVIVTRERPAREVVDGGIDDEDDEGNDNGDRPPMPTSPRRVIPLTKEASKPPSSTYTPVDPSPPTTRTHAHPSPIRPSSSVKTTVNLAPQRPGKVSAGARMDQRGGKLAKKSPYGPLSITSAQNQPGTSKTQSNEPISFWPTPPGGTGHSNLFAKPRLPISGKPSTMRPLSKKRKRDSDDFYAESTSDFPSPPPPPPPPRPPPPAHRRPRGEKPTTAKPPTQLDLAAAINSAHQSNFSEEQFLARPKFPKPDARSPPTRYFARRGQPFLLAKRAQHASSHASSAHASSVQVQHTGRRRNFDYNPRSNSTPSSSSMRPPTVLSTSSMRPPTVLSASSMRPPPGPSTRPQPTQFIKRGVRVDSPRSRVPTDSSNAQHRKSFLWKTPGGRETLSKPVPKPMPMQGSSKGRRMVVNTTSDEDDD